jgi:hypothetical protein
MGLIWKCIEEDQFESGIKDILKRLSGEPTGGGGFQRKRTTWAGTGPILIF